MKKQSAAVKAFEINKDPSIYGTFAEIGAGQETVNFFYRAGLASQTVAKSMSAYDMTVSDEIYGKQTRYVSKERLLTMLDREYRLLEKRLKGKSGTQTRYFVFAETAATGAQTKSSSRHRHAWMGLRFQHRPLEPFSDIVFHVNCLDISRLEQHESLGVLGVNLIHSAFYFKNKPSRLISLLTDNLSESGKIEVQSLSCQGPAFNTLSFPERKKKPLHNKKPRQTKALKDNGLSIWLNMEILRQNLSPLAFFPTAKASEFLSDSAFNRQLVILYKDKSLIKDFQKNRKRILQTLFAPLSSRNFNRRDGLKEPPTPFKVFSAFDPWQDQALPPFDKAFDLSKFSKDFFSKEGHSKQKKAFAEFLSQMLISSKNWRNQKTAFTVKQLLALCRGELPLLKEENFYHLKEIYNTGPAVKNQDFRIERPKPLIVFFTPKKHSIPAFRKNLKEICGQGISVLTANDLPLDKLKELISLYTKGPLVFVARPKTSLADPSTQEKGMPFTSSMRVVKSPSSKQKQGKGGPVATQADFLPTDNLGKFSPSATGGQSVLTSLGTLFAGGTKLVSLSEK